MNRTEAFHFAQHGGFNDARKGAAIMFAVMEADVVRRADASALRSIIERARVYLARMAVNTDKAPANNRRKFVDALFDYSAATGLALA